MVEANVNLTKAVSSGDTKAIESAKAEYLHQSKDALSDWLDRKYGSTITENAIFESLPRYWENEFHKDMNALNVCHPFHNQYQYQFEIPNCCYY